VGPLKYQKQHDIIKTTERWDKRERLSKEVVEGLPVDRSDPMFYGYRRYGTTIEYDEPRVVGDDTYFVTQSTDATQAAAKAVLDAGYDAWVVSKTASHHKQIGELDGFDPSEIRELALGNREQHISAQRARSWRASVDNRTPKP
jgi:hypothetical protein